MDSSRPDRHARPLLPNRLGGRPTRRARPARPLSLRDGGSRAAPAARAVLSLLPVQRRHLGVRRRRLPLDARPPDTHRALDHRTARRGRGAAAVDHRPLAQPARSTPVHLHGGRGRGASSRAGPQGVGRRGDQSVVHHAAPAAGDEARKVGLPLIVHATGLWEAKDALRAGARVLVHSVWSGPVDDEFLALARRAGATYVPTLTVVDGYGQVTARRFVPDRPALVCVDRATRAKAFATDTVALAQRAPLSLRQRLGRIVRSIAPDLGGGRRRDQGSLNLKRVFDAGIPVALGTDAGNPLTLHGASVFRELEAMQASGLAPRDVLLAATRNAARALALDSTGTVTAGAVADLLVLDADPLTDIRHLRDIALVIHRGEAYTRRELEYP